MVKTILFDLDGTLIQSLSSLRGVYLEFLSAVGASSSTKEFDDLNGKNLNEIVTILKERYRLPQTIAELRDTYRECVQAVYKKVTATPGADPLLRTLSASGYTLGLVTSAPQALAESVIRQQGWDTLFSLYSYGDQVAHAKPDPEIYLKAVSLSGEIPEDIIAVEDSAHGVRAATLAGIRTIGFSSTKDAQKLLLVGADTTVAALSEILPILSAWKEESYRVVAVGDVVIRVVPVNAEFEIKRVGYASRTDAVWESLSRTRTLFNGSMFSVSSIKREDNRLEVNAYTLSYKDFLAERHDPSIRLGVRPIGVSGMSIVRDAHDTSYVVFARRKASVTQWPGRLELVPSGGIDARRAAADGIISYETQAVEELTEETGVSADKIVSIKGFALVYDTRERVYDICCQIQLSLRKEELEEIFTGSVEYDKPLCVASQDIQKFIATHREEIVPTSLALLSAWHTIDKIR